MAKIAYINIPAHGHTNPTLPVVRSLVERGHHVLYYNTEEMRGKIAPMGVDFRPYPEPVPTTAEISRAMHEFVDAAIIIAGISEKLTGWMIDQMAEERPDIILYDSIALWGYIAARTLQIPHVTSMTHFVLDGSTGHLSWRDLFRYVVSVIPKLPRILKWRRHMIEHYGKDNFAGITAYGDRALVFTSREFHPSNTVVDERFRFVGPALQPETRVDVEHDLPFDQMGEGHKVYISLGTVNNRDTAFYRMAFEAFGNFPAHFILSVGKHTDIAKLGEIPSNFTVRNYVPQLDVLQHVDVFITHGGMNSTHEGLYYGVPEIVIPQQIEQLLNGLRVREVGAGLLLGEYAPYGRVTADELRQALMTILDDTTYQKQAQKYGETLRSAGGTARAVAEIETFLDQVIDRVEVAQSV